MNLEKIEKSFIPSSDKKSSISKRGMVATAFPQATEAGIEMLKKGGNAVDAAIAAGVLLGLCEPQMTGIGGDCFVLYNRAGENRVRALNGSGRAAAAAHADHLRAQGRQTVPLNTADAVTIPGAMDAFCRLAETEGKLGLDAILAPAIHYADEGVPVAPRVAFDWGNDASTLQGSARAAYLFDGKAPTQGNSKP